ncbi:bifunctional DNA primase/polymerase [Streptomyces sp. NPDC059477]|uniref:bifunctional DNA primase/polymerase n=1 Tax=Streptomyces sp. NPDC059477 TaxID=3346847 RepID=UPI0036BECC30
MRSLTWRDVEWLAEAADEPAACRAAWANDPRTPYALATGRCFDVVTVDQRLGIEAFDLLLRRGLPLGPAVLDRTARRGGFLSAPARGAGLHSMCRPGAGADAPAPLSEPRFGGRRARPDAPAG